MTKVDERAAVPVVDERVRERLAAAFDRPGVAAAYLFGSQATGRTGPLSDIDIAVWTDSGEARLDLRLELIGKAAEAAGTGEIDVVILNGAPPLLRHRAIRDGVLLVERDAQARVRLETEALLTYLDTAHLRETLAAGRRRRLAEDRFGRR